MRPLDVIDDLKKRYVNTDIDWERMLEHAYRRFLGPESVVVDVGGHAGRHADVFVRELGCAGVAIVEPLPDHAAALRARYADAPGVTVHACALGAHAGTSRFVFNAGSPEESGLRERRYNDPDAKHLIELEVEVSTLDALCAGFDRLDFVKIDTEGGEVDILTGGQQTLRRLRPVISAEYGAAGYEAYGYRRSTLFELARAEEYTLFDLFGHPLATPEDWDTCVDNFYWDYLMAPNERAVAFQASLEGQLDLVDQSLMHAH